MIVQAAGAIHFIKFILHRFRMKQKWKNHMMMHAGRKPHECEECGVGFVHKQSWAAHIRSEIASHNALKAQ